MPLITPVVILLMLGGIVVSREEGPVREIRPLLAFLMGAGMLTLSAIQLAGNQFGYDRAAFRAYVLAPIPRQDLLLGKNLALVPLTSFFGLLGVAVIGIAYPMRLDHYLAAVIQLLSCHLIVCLVGNTMAILAPIPIAPGGVQPAQVRLVPLLIQMLLMMLIPFAFIPVAIPIGLEALLVHSDLVSRYVPVSLLGSVVVFLLVVKVYIAVIRVQGGWLQDREKDILAVVTSKTD